VDKNIDPEEAKVQQQILQFIRDETPIALDIIAA
jgi:hypothetical protein